MIAAGPALDATDAAALRRRAIFELHKYDPQCGDVSVIAPFALTLDAPSWRALAAQAEALDREMRAAERAIAADSRALAALALPLPIRPLASPRFPLAPSATLARYVRFDFHPTREGWRISEANSDVPSGFGEAGGLGRLFVEHGARGRVAADPAAALADAIAARAGASGEPVALLYATAYTDDRQVMLSIRDALAARGVTSVLGAPDALRWSVRGDASFGPEGARVPLAGVVRNFPAEWLPKLLRGGWWRFFRGGRTPAANPGLALLSQTKRFPIACARLGLDMPAWAAALPETRDLRDPRVDLSSGEWVLKPALGRVGEDVAVPGVSAPRAWRGVVRAAARRPSRWVAQRAFETLAIPTPAGAMHPCVGVFVIEGRAAGLYGRLSPTGVTDGAALEVAVLVEEDREAARAARGGEHVERI